jgi:hypothetical protein
LGWGKMPPGGQSKTDPPLLPERRLSLGVREVVNLKRIAIATKTTSQQHP